VEPQRHPWGLEPLQTHSPKTKEGSHLDLIEGAQPLEDEMKRNKIYLLLGMLALASFFATSCKEPEKPAEPPPAQPTP